MAKKILKKNVVGEELQSYVSNQIKRRQKTHGSGVLSSRSTEELIQLNSANSWVKLASGVSVTDEKLQDLGISGEGIERFKKMGLAKNHILFGGVSNLTNNGDNYKLNQQNDFIGTYEPEQDFGIVPMPGIKDLTIKALNRGSLKKAIIKIKAQNRNQLNVLDALYLRLGYTVLLEWGNSTFLNNEGGRLEKVQDTILENKQLFFNEGWEEKAYDDVLEKIEDYRIQYQGNYDGMLGKISNFDWKFNNDGSYDVTLTVLSYGDIIESLKTNITADVNTYSFINNSGNILSQQGTAVNDNRGSNYIFTLLQTLKIVSNIRNSSGKRIYITPQVTIQDNNPKKIGDFIQTGPSEIDTTKKKIVFKAKLKLFRTIDNTEVKSSDLKYYKLTPYENITTISNAFVGTIDDKKTTFVKKYTPLTQLFLELSAADHNAFATTPWNTTDNLGYSQDQMQELFGQKYGISKTNEGKLTTFLNSTFQPWPKPIIYNKQEEYGDTVFVNTDGVEKYDLGSVKRNLLLRWIHYRSVSISNPSTPESKINFDFWRLPSPGYIGTNPYKDISNPNYNKDTIGKKFYPASFAPLNELSGIGINQNISSYTLQSLLSREQKKTYIGIDSENIGGRGIEDFEDQTNENLIKELYPQDYTTKAANLGTFNISNKNEYFYHPETSATEFTPSNTTQTRRRLAEFLLQKSPITLRQSYTLKEGETDPAFDLYKYPTIVTNETRGGESGTEIILTDIAYYPTFNILYPYITWGLKGENIKLEGSNVVEDGKKVIFTGLESNYGSSKRGTRITQIPVITSEDFEFKGVTEFDSSTLNDTEFKNELDTAFTQFKSNDSNQIEEFLKKPDYDTSGVCTTPGRFEFFHRFAAKSVQEARNNKKPFYFDIQHELTQVTISTGKAKNPLKVIDSFDEKGVVVFNTNPNKYYIRFGFLLQLVKDKTILKILTGAEDYNNNPSMFNIAYQQGISDMLCMPNQMSFDLSTCFVRRDNMIYFEGKNQQKNYNLFPEVYPWKHSNINDKNEYFSSPKYEVKTNLEFYEETFNSPIAKGNDNCVADTMNIYLEFDFVGNCMISSTDERGNMSTYDFVNNMCIGLNKALGGVNNLEPVIDETANTLYIMDSSPKYDNNKISKKDYELQVLGYNLKEKIDINNTVYNTIESTFSRKIDLKTAITPEYATMIAIGATAAGYAKGIEATSFATWNKGLIDRFQKNIGPAEEAKSGNISENTSNIELFREGVIENYQQMMSLDNEKNNYNSLAIVPNGIKKELDISKIKENVSIATEYYKFLFGNRAANNPDKFVGGGTGFIPFKLNVTLDGISGFKIYQKLTVNTDFLPDGYAVTTEFIITGVDHVLRDNDWETNLKLIMLPKFEDYEEIITLDTFRSTAVTYNTQTLSSQKKNTVDNDSKWADLVVEATECVFSQYPPTTTEFWCARYSSYIAQSITNKIDSDNCGNVTTGWGDANNPNYKDKIESTGKYVLQNDGIIEGPDLATKMVDFFNNSNWEYGDVVQYYLLPNPNSSDPNEVNGYNKYVTNFAQWKAGNGTKVKRNSSAAYHTQVYTGKYSKNNNGTGWTTDKKNNYGTAFVYKSKTYLPGDKYQINVFKVKDNIVNTYN
jgi:hypothetical protein